MTTSRLRRVKPLLGASLAVLVSVAAPLGRAEDTAAAHTAQAQGYFADGKYKEAVIELKNALEASPDDREARFLLGKAYLELGEGGFAEKELRHAQDLGIQGIDRLLAQSLLQQRRFREVIEQFPVRSGMSAEEAAKLHALRGTAFSMSGDRDAAAREYETALGLQPDTAEAIVGQAAIAAERADTARARTLLERAVELRPAYAPAWAALGEIMYAQQDLAAAEEAYGKAIEHGANSFVYRVHRALIRIERDETDAAQEDIADLEKADAKSPDLAYVEGRLFFRQGRFAEAEERLTRAQASVRFAGPNEFFLGATELALGNLEQASASLGHFANAYPASTVAARLLAQLWIRMGDLDGAERLLTDRLRVSPEDPELVRAMAAVKIARNDRRAADRYLRKAAEQEPQSADNLTGIGVNLLRAGPESRGEAMQVLQQALATDTESLSAAAALVAGHLQASDYDRALESALAMQRQHPQSAAAWNLVGIAHGAKKDFEASKHAFEKALELAPGDPSAAANMAALAVKEGRIDAARAYYEQVLKHHPDHEATLIKLAELELGARNPDAFRSTLERAKAAHPKSLEPRILLARYYKAQNQPAEGIAVLKEVEAEYRSSPAYQTNLGWLLLMAGEPASGVRAFAKAAELQPGSAEAQYLLANAHAAAQNPAGFQISLLKALEMDPKHPLSDSLVAAYLNVKDDAAARAGHLDELAALIPEHPEVLYAQAAAVLQRLDFPAAQVAFAQGGERFPAQSRWVVGLSQALLGRGQGQEAVAALARWLSDHPEDQQVRLVLANVFMQQGRAADARVIFNQLVEDMPDNPVVLNNLSWLLRSDDPARALGYAEHAVAVTQEADPRALDTLGVILTTNEQAERALSVLRKALDKSPADPSMLYHYAQALDKAGRANEARTLLRRLLAGPEKFSEREEAAAMLARLGGG